MAHGLSCSVAHRIFLDQGPKPCPALCANGFLITLPPERSPQHCIRVCKGVLRSHGLESPLMVEPGVVGKFVFNGICVKINNAIQLAVLWALGCKLALWAWPRHNSERNKP